MAHFPISTNITHQEASNIYLFVCVTQGIRQYYKRFTYNNSFTSHNKHHEVCIIIIILIEERGTVGLI